MTEARFGNTGYNILRGPGLFNWDFGLTREIRGDTQLQSCSCASSRSISPTRRISANPDNNVGDGEDFMTITSVQDLGREGIDERQFRLGIRIVF